MFINIPIWEIHNIAEIIRRKFQSLETFSNRSLYASLELLVHFSRLHQTLTFKNSLKPLLYSVSSYYFIGNRN